MKNGITEFWAYSCRGPEEWYLGKFQDGIITECEGFYHSALPWDVQKGGLRLFEEFKEEYGC